MTDSAPRTLRWVSWAAVSSQPQAAADKISIAEQLEQNRSHADRHGGEVVADLIIPGESRSIDTWEEACERIGAYAQLRDLLQRRAFDVLVYYDASRLARTLSLGSTIRQLCARRGIVLYQTTAPPSELRAGWRHDQALVDAIQSVGAQEEVAKLVERNRIGMIGRIKRGEFSRGPIYGYQLRYDPDGTHQIVINPDQAAVVREVFRLYLDGVGIEGVRAILTGRGHISPTGMAWTEGGVRTVLENGWKYAGYAEINREGKHKRELVRAPAVWEAIIDEETARMFEDERAARSVNRRLPGTTDKLAGVCYCAVCGQSMHVQDCTRVWNGVEHIYCYRRCIRHKPNINIRVEVIERALRDEIAMLQGVDIDMIVGEVPDVLEPLRRQIVEAEGAHKRVAAALQRADDAYIDGLMNEERYQAQVTRLQAQHAAGEKEQERLKAQIAAEDERGSRRQRLADVRDYGLARLDDPDPQTLNLWLRRHVRVYCASRAVIGIIWL